MIDFSKIDSLSVVNEYERLKLFPKIGRKNSLNELFSGFDTSGTNYLTEIKSLGLSAGSLNDNQIEGYLLKSVSFSLQSFLKGVNYFNSYKSGVKNLQNCFTQNFLNGYYSHLFLAYSIIQFHGINIKLKPISGDKQEIWIQYIDLNSKILCEFNTTKKTYSDDKISHGQFWDIFYNYILHSGGTIGGNDKMSFMKFPNYPMGYRTRGKFGNPQDFIEESLSRNYHTYYNFTYFKNIDGKVSENIKTGVTDIKISDYTILEEIIEFEIAYLLGLFSLVCSENDINKNLYKFLNFGYLKQKKQDILYDIKGFQYNLGI